MFEGLRLSHWKVAQGTDGVLMLTMDRNGSNVNALSRALLDELDAMLERCVRGEYGAEHALRLYLRHIVDAFGRGQKAQRLLARLGWQLDAPAAIVAAMDDGAERIRSALVRLNDPQLQLPDDPTLYMLTRAVIGAVRSAAVEESAMLDDPRFEEALFRMVWGLLQRPLDGA